MSSLQMMAMPGGKAFMPIMKIDKEQRLVYGYASTPTLDYDGETITLEAITGAVPGYMKFGNIREMHQPSAVGIAKEANVDDKGLYLCAKIVDDVAWNKVKEGVYKGFSIGGKATARDPRNKKVITGLEMVEISIVDRPACPDAVIDFFKVAQTPEETVSKADPTIDEMRAALAKTVSDLEPDDVVKAFTSAGLTADDVPAPAAEPAPVAKAADAQPDAAPQAAAEPAPAAQEPAPVAKAAEPEPAPTPIAKSPAELVAERLVNGEDKEGFAKAAAVAMDMNDGQLAGLLKLNKFGLTRWLANNEGLCSKAAELLPKTFTRASQIAAALAKPDPGKAGAAMAAAAAPLAKVADPAQDVAGDYGPNDQAGYADPGLQKDAKPRFPLMEDGKHSPARIRAAWDHINKSRNQEPYSPDQVELIKATIGTAWKAAIDKDGPSLAKATTPEINPENPVTKTLNDMGPDGKDNVQKGLMATCSALRLLAGLNELKTALEAEAGIEEDNSPMPGRFKALLELFAQAAQDLLAEEVGELLASDKVTVDYPVYIAYADKATNLVKRIGGGPAFADLLIKQVGDRTGEKGYANLIKFAEEVLAKAAAPQTQDWPTLMTNFMGSNSDWPTLLVNHMGKNDDWVGKAQDIADLALSKGAKCSHDMEKAKKAKDPVEDEERDPPPPAKDEKDPVNGEEKEPKEEDEEEKKKKAAGLDSPAAATPAADPVSKAAPLDLDAVLKGVGALIDSKLEPVLAKVDAVEKGRNPPLPSSSRSPVDAVDKSQDTADVGGALEKVQTGDAKPMDVLKACRQNPQILPGRSSGS